MLFLQVLSERFDPGDAYQKRLQELVGLFAQVAAQDLDSPQHPQSWRYKEPTQTATAVFQTLIQEKTAHFSGRQHVFTAVADFINSAPNGYFLIEGEPGIGKSAILARYVQQNDCPAYFNVRALGNNTPHDFLTSLCQQLVVRYNLPYPHLPPDATEDGRFLTRLLNEIAPRLSAQNPLIIAVDALDEVEQNRVAHGENLLYLPPYLPPHVFFLVTQRPLTHSFVTYAPLRPFDLMAYTAENRADVAAFIGRFAQRPRLQRWLTQQASSSDHFIQTLTDKSEDNFMYLRYVLYDIEYGIYRDVNLEQLPAGLLPYYADHWQRMGMQTTPLPHAKLTIIYVLCEAQQPISPTLIANFSSQDGLIVQTVIDEWRQFLHRYPFDSQYQYTLYHHSFRDFLHQKEIIQATGLTLPDINAQIADYLWQTMMNDE
ncbi:MAG: ATP-binding protein [Anaerolineales bacterium]|nr:ATP-binding protein [Anaerolineales bacterium]